MPNENKAGALVITDSQMIEEAVSLLGTIENSLFEAMDSVASDFAESNGWIGEYEMHEDGECWLAPPDWNLAASEEEPQVKAWFAIQECIDDAEDYWINMLCGRSLSGSELGFKFFVDHSRFGGRQTWNQFVRTIPSVISEIESMGFKHIGRGVFCLPIHLDCECLATVWEENGGFAHDDDCFEPLRERLETLKHTEPLFSQILSQAAAFKAPAKSGSKA